MYRRLKNVAGAMGPSSRLIISDMIIPDKDEFGDEVTPYWMDFNCKYTYKAVDDSS
jgi:hypothetical protein